mmetsp:Transcript_303/g.760  ORF Transcript_303/g.760 Transcript_303/m.760 type:complete len:220 (+) Transcript_303:1082-1741(+)
MVPLTMPNFSCSTFTKGARQLVVQEALEMMGYSCLYWSALTPTTKVGMSLPLAGAVISTFLAPAVMCLLAPGVSMNTPVPSITRSMSMAFQGSWVGSREDTTLMFLPFTAMVESSTTFTSALKVPRVESYFSRWLACFTPPESLMATTSSRESLRPSQQRRKLRPMRPKPLMATRTFFWARTSILTTALLTLAPFFKPDTLPVKADFATECAILTIWLC